MAQRDEKGYIHYTQEELNQVPPFEQRDRGPGGFMTNFTGVTFGALTGGILGSALGPAGTVAGGIAGGAVGTQLDRTNQPGGGAPRR